MIATLAALATVYSLSGRSIADNCTWLYRIETDFQIQVDDPAANAVVVWLKDLYTAELREPEILPLGAFTAVTMSQNPRYLAHEAYLALQRQGEGAPARPDVKVDFSPLMRRCHDYTHREEVPFEPLTVVDAD